MSSYSRPLPSNIVPLDPKNKVMVRKAAACLCAAFLGNTIVPGAPIMTEAYYGKQFSDQPLDEMEAKDFGLKQFNNWIMNFTLYRELPFGGVFVYVEDDVEADNLEETDVVDVDGAGGGGGGGGGMVEEKSTKKYNPKKCNNKSEKMIVSSVAVCIPPNNNNWDMYSDYQPSVLALAVCPWNCSRVGLPPFSVLCDCCYESAKRLRIMDQADGKKYIYFYSLMIFFCTHHALNEHFNNTYILIFIISCVYILVKLFFFFYQKEKMRQRLMGDQTYWYLHAIGTTPRMQKKGRATALIDALSNLADVDNVAVYIESGSLTNYFFYEKRGFMKLDTIHPYHFSKSCALVRPRKSDRNGGGGSGSGSGSGGGGGEDAATSTRDSSASTGNSKDSF